MRQRQNNVILTQKTNPTVERLRARELRLNIYISDIYEFFSLHCLEFLEFLSVYVLISSAPVIRRDDLPQYIHVTR